jgi:hypothetical protein
VAAASPQQLLFLSRATIRARRHHRDCRSRVHRHQPSLATWTASDHRIH